MYRLKNVKDYLANLCGYNSKTDSPETQFNPELSPEASTALQGLFGIPPREVRDSIDEIIRRINRGLPPDSGRLSQIRCTR